jgi:hypothetical protein
MEDIQKRSYDIIKNIDKYNVVINGLSEDLYKIKRDVYKGNDYTLLKLQNGSDISIKKDIFELIIKEYEERISKAKYDLENYINNLNG